MEMKLLSEIELFKELETLHMAHLCSIAIREEAAAGTLLFDDGDQGDSLYVISKGEIRISKAIPGMGEEALAILKPGAYFGEMEYIDRQLHRAAQAIVHRRVVLYRFRYTDLDDLMGTDASLALAIQRCMLQTLARRLRATNDKVTAMFAMAQFG